MKTNMKRKVASILVVVVMFTLLVPMGKVNANPKSKTIQYDLNITTSFDLSIDITATHQNGKWLSVSSIEPNVSSNISGYDYKIGDNNLVCDVTDSAIKLSGSFTVKRTRTVLFITYTVSEQTVTVDKTFRAKDYL